MKPSCFVFDLDGTLCNVFHRIKWVASYPKNWEAFNAGIALDTLNEPVFNTLVALANSHPIVLLSGRSEEHRDVTEEWLRGNQVPYSHLLMRPLDDFRSDDIVKSELADIVEQSYSIQGVFDDRSQVVKMWQSRGIFVFDVAQGRGDF